MVLLCGHYYFFNLVRLLSHLESSKCFINFAFPTVLNTIFTAVLHSAYISLFIRSSIEGCSLESREVARGIFTIKRPGSYVLLVLRHLVDRNY